ncbi:uncharacterized protein METZ01_LOCUS256217, partial [marine metagenome]
MSYEIKKCRLSKSSHLISVLDLGNQYLTGIFPSSKNEPISKGPLELVWCEDSKLLQLKHSFPLDQMYGDNYGYRSGLNQSMVNHLTQKVKLLENKVLFNSKDIVIDIGSNDATTLKAYNRKDIIKVGIDPTGKKFKKYYNDDMILISDFFPTEKFQLKFPNKKAKIITSIAMIYDLENPLNFFQSIAEILDENGIWHFEQSYLPSMLETNAYDTICHEHLEYYTLGNIKYMLEQANLKIIDVQINDINGGSFAVTAAHMHSNIFSENKATIDSILAKEQEMGLSTLNPFREFERRVFEHRNNLRKLVSSLVSDGKKVFGYGASTKGNVILQFCGFSSK